MKPANEVRELTPREKIEAAARELGVVLSFEFVPFSRSRNKDNAGPGARNVDRMSLNWRVTVSCETHKILTTDYSAGIAHGLSVHEAEAIRRECEAGKIANGRPIAPPSVADVLASLVMDSSAIDYSTYEEWAGDCGHDPDSRKGEAIYRACLEIALKLRNGLGEAGLAALREAAQDY